jgi:hypothetical protein
MARAEFFTELFIILRLLVLIAYHECDRGAGGFPFENPGQDLHPVLLLTRRSERGGPRSSPVKEWLDIFLCKVHAGRAAIDYNTDNCTMALAKGCNPEVPAK